MTLDVYVDIDPLSKQHNMAHPSPGLWRGHARVEAEPAPMFSRKIGESVDLLRAFGYRVEELGVEGPVVRDAETVRLLPAEYAAYAGEPPVWAETD